MMSNDAYNKSIYFVSLFFLFLPIYIGKIQQKNRRIMNNNNYNNMFESDANGSKKVPRLYALYIIRTSKNTLYTGVSTNVVRRLQQHRSGRASLNGGGKGPLLLVYQSEYFMCASCAIRLEKLVKRQSRLVKEQMIAHKPSREELVSFMNRLDRRASSPQ
ncbi:ORF121 [Leucania separata nucleopolyhedrovirus]|uniref:ORF121 n=1 Tax=Leucania separata nucleopolyhedrovirus TaxID=1307956 RepID=Q0IKZ8_NPVLS|nr:ORF121 [Leucania separata nucleopolyhedrovirus]AAR28885.1 ORF121 [Leucania separata nucleopolyhedrovirus]